ncbi:mitochondrial carrier protein, putative, partial [Hepatocystis sp. ex Piliocolobus tephrosceles]
FSSITTIPATCLYFCCFEYLKQKVINYNSKITDRTKADNKRYENLSFVNYFSLALLSEAICCILFVPLEVIKERLQAQKQLKLKEYTNSYKLIQHLLHKERIPRVGNKLMVKLEIESANFNNFKLNMCCSFLSGFITSPLEVVRIRLQVQEKNKTPFYYNNFFDGIKQLWREGNNPNGILNLFKGNFYRCYLLCLSMSINVTIINMYKKLYSPQA